MESNLMNIRYKQINDWPFMNNQYAIGKIYVFENAIDAAIISQYPHLFRKLHWFENREAEELPEYLKDVNGEVWKVWEYTSVFSTTVNLKKNFKDEERPYGNHSLYELYPATEQEYTTYINQKQIQ